MYILQVSDLHISDTSVLKTCKSKFESLLSAVKSKLSKDDTLVCCTCGDVFDSGNIKGASIATELYDYIKSGLLPHKIKFEFIPGNHDIVDNKFNAYDKFIRKYQAGNKYCYSNNSVVIRNYDDLDIVLINSSYHKDHKYGMVDLPQLDECLKSCNNNIIIVIHHTLMSRYDDDSSCIRNAYDFLEVISKFNVVALLHGHTHGYSDIIVGNNCKVVGVGPSLKTVADVPNQFNLIKIVAGDIETIDNHTYRRDKKRYDWTTVYQNKYNNRYVDNNLPLLYKKVVNCTKSYGCINNFYMQFSIDIKTFKKYIDNTFKDSLEIAKAWQSNVCPETLYYNHGTLMDAGDISGLDYIVKELTSKTTSSRAILPLVCVEDVKQSGNSFLPSLDIIQFGFEDEAKTKLYITIYLRALEVNHFLKINICEVYIMADYVKSKIKTITDLNVTINSFRAQYKDRFGCFKKADIDTIDVIDMSYIVSDKNIPKLKHLLNNKLELTETVVKNEGINNLCNCIIKYNGKDHVPYNTDVVESIKKLNRLYTELIELTCATSIYDKVKDKEDEVTSQIKKVISKLSKMEK